MMGHNSMNATSLDREVFALEEELNSARQDRRGTQQSMMRIARRLLAVDKAAGNERISDLALKERRIVRPTDLIGNANERQKARWLARGGVEGQLHVIGPVDDFSTDALNRLEARFGGDKRRFEKATTYGAVYSGVIREAVAKIRKALAGGEDAPKLDDVRKEFADVIFDAETVDGWIEAEKAKLSGEGDEEAELKKAVNLALADPKRRAEIAKALKAELTQIKKDAEAKRKAKERAEKAKTSSVKGDLKKLRDKADANVRDYAGDASEDTFN